MTKDQKAFINLLMSKVEERGISMKDASKKIGRDKSYMSVLMNNPNPTLATIQLIEKKLKIKLMDWPDTKKK